MNEQPRSVVVVQPAVDKNGHQYFQRAPEQPDYGRADAEADEPASMGSPTPGPTRQPLTDDWEVFTSEETFTLFLDAERRLWVELWRELDYGSQNELENALVTGITAAEARSMASSGTMQIHTNLGRQREMKLALYIKDWSLQDREHKPIKWPRNISARIGLVKRMNPRLAREILKAIDNLIAEQGEQLAADGYDAGRTDEVREPDPTRTDAAAGAAP